MNKQAEIDKIIDDYIFEPTKIFVGNITNIIFVFICLFLLFSSKMQFNYVEKLKSLIFTSTYKITEPLFIVSNNINNKISSYLEFVRYKKLDLLDIENLSKEYAIKKLYIENSELRKKLDLPESYVEEYGLQEWNIKKAEIFGNFWNENQKTAYINQNIESEFAIIATTQKDAHGNIEFILVGIGKKSESQTSNISQITLLTDRNFVMPAKYLSGAKFIVAGDNSFFPKIKYAKNLSLFENNQTIYSSSDKNFIPDNIKIGVSKEIDKQMRVIPSINWNNLNYVYIFEKKT